MDGIKPQIAPKSDISDLIQVSRWAFLAIGIWYGNNRWHEIAAIRGAEKAKEIAAFDVILDREEAARVAANKEFEATSILYGNPETVEPLK